MRRIIAEVWLLQLLLLTLTGKCWSFSPCTKVRSIQSTTLARGLVSLLMNAEYQEVAMDDSSDNEVYDVAIIGSGPAACSLAALLTASKTTSSAATSSSTTPNVVVVSKYADKRWVPNYGMWTDEWKALSELYEEHGVPGLWDHGIDTQWDDTDCFFGEMLGEDGTPIIGANHEGSHRRTVGKAYVRISRTGLKDIFYNMNRNYEVIRSNVLGAAVNTNVYMPPGSIVFHESFTKLTLQQDEESEESTPQTIRAKIVVDATGAESPFTIREDRGQEGYQIAYGVECRVEGEGVTDTHVGDYDRSKMTLFDFRSQAWRTDDNTACVKKEPTFNYVMPLTQDVIFFEETSLVANPAMSFQDCKSRLNDRLASQQVSITDILEEEFCYIPMGGGLPRLGQRIVPIGAAAGLVHPATGYQVGRCLASNVDVAQQIRFELEQQQQPGKSFDPDAAAARIMGQALWTPENIRRRNFSVMGGEFFMTLNVDELRRFFAGFFRLEPDYWCAFLSQWTHLPGFQYQKDWLARLSFGLTALVKLSPDLAFRMAWYILTYPDLYSVAQSVTPFLGIPEPYEKSLEFRENKKGDQAAKDEAMEMLCNCDRCEDAATVVVQEKEAVAQEN